jgi:hypothetical protein
MSRRQQILAKITTQEERAAMEADEKRASDQKAARKQGKRLEKNERARERRAAANQGIVLCTKKWVPQSKLGQYVDVPDVFTLVPTDHHAYCYQHGAALLRTPRLVHTGGNDGHCKCLDCSKGLVWKACCTMCNAHLFSYG